MYFGDKNPERCGNCDVCRRRNELGLSRYEFDLILADIKTVMQTKPVTPFQLQEELKQPAAKIAEVLRWLLENDKVQTDDDGLMRWKSGKA
jgi:hypothetical protein